MAQSCLVVGATGFVGSYVTRELLRKGYQVRGTCRDPAQAQWLLELLPGAPLTLHPLTLTPRAADNVDTMEKLANGCTGLFMCAGYEKQELETIDFMRSAGQLAVNSALKSGAAATTVILTSSTGSTNPPNTPADAVKDEITFWSDPEFQKEKGRFSPAAKTTMEIEALKMLGRNQRNEVVDEETAKRTANVRLCILNPSLILAPQLQPGSISGNGLPWFANIVKGEAMRENIPNDSMSIIHCEDLARLHVACLEKPDASGRYFGVNRSWAWEEILKEVQKIVPAYKMPPKTFEKQSPITQFDNTRRDSLGVKLKSLSEILSDTIGFLRQRGMLPE